MINLPSSGLDHIQDFLERHVRISFDDEHPYRLPPEDGAKSFFQFTSPDFLPVYSYATTWDNASSIRTSSAAVGPKQALGYPNPKTL
jgi:hypothetical protein